MGPCLICVDLQGAYLEDPDLEPAAGAVVGAAAAWLAEFRERDLPVVHVRTTVEADGPALPHWDEAARRRFARDAPGWRFAPQAAPRGDEPIVDKTHYSAFQSALLPALLDELAPDELVLIGVHLHGCIRSTALDASAAGHRVRIGSDATASNDPPHAAATRRWMSQRGFPFAELAEWRSAAARAPGDGGHSPKRADAAFAGWSGLEAERRRAALEPLAGLLRDESAALAGVITAEIHKPPVDARAELSLAADLAQRALECAAGLAHRSPDGLARRVPHGPVLLITPWNNPVAIPVGKIVPALALGNTVVWKPSPHAPSASAALHALLRRLDLPDGVLELVQGDAEEAAALVDSGAIRAVSVTGSLRTGRALQDRCAARMIPLQAELGGNNAAIVCPDADVEEAAASIAAGAFSFAGQRCTATRRAIAIGDAYEPLTEALKGEIDALRGGPFPPVVSAAAATRLEQLIERAAADGATVRRPDWKATPTCVAPALIEDADPASEIAQEESFGPILVLQRARDLDHAIALCNGVAQGLAASIHTDSAADVHRFAAAVRAGILKVNRSEAGAGASLPFGGHGLSGLGPPEHGEGDAEFYGRWQALYGEEPAGGAGSPTAEASRIGAGSRE